MLARASTFTLDGLDARAVTVEVDVRRGLPSFGIIGLADTAIREARERVRTAIINSGLAFPALRVTASLAPADLRKAGPGLDLPLACALLAASDQLPPERLDGWVLFGELGLDGSLRGARGTLAIADAAARSAAGQLLLAQAGAEEAALVPGIGVHAAASLRDALAVLRGEPRARSRARARAMKPRGADATCTPATPAHDLSDVRGQHDAVRALVVAAAGGHNLLLSGAPGTGKTMIARRAPSILPPLDAAEAVEVARIESSLGREVRSLPSERPFRAPHHTITPAGMMGAGPRGWAGEAVRAHHGVLFLDSHSLCSLGSRHGPRRLLPRLPGQGPRGRLVPVARPPAPAD